MTGNTKKNQKFEAESSGAKIDESSVMVTGMVPMFIEFEGEPIWINTDLNSKRAFRPQKIKFEVSFSVVIQVVFCINIRNVNLSILNWHQAL